MVQVDIRILDSRKARRMTQSDYCWLGTWKKHELIVIRITYQGLFFVQIQPREFSPQSLEKEQVMRFIKNCQWKSATWLYPTDELAPWGHHATAQQVLNIVSAYSCCTRLHVNATKLVPYLIRSYGDFLLFYHRTALWLFQFILSQGLNEPRNVENPLVCCPLLIVGNSFCDLLGSRVPTINCSSV